MPFNAFSNTQPAGAASRRKFLAGAAALATTSGALLSGCAAPQPQREGIDPTSLIYPPPPETPRFFYERTIWGSNDAIEETSNDRLRRFATGESVRGRGFAKPFGVAVQEGRLFVSDTVNRHVHVLDFPRRRYYDVGRRGVGRLMKPLDVAVDGAGQLYVCDGSARRVLVYDLEGNYTKSIGGEDYLTRPSGVAVNPAGDRIYIVDTGGVQSRNHRVQIFDGSGGHLRTIGRRGGANGEFNLPLTATVSPEGELYVVDAGNFRVQIFGPEGDFRRRIGEAGRFPGQMSHPKGCAIDSEGKVYVSDTSFGIFQIFNREGRILMSVGLRDESGGPGRMLLPAGIAVDVDQRIYVADQFFRKVEVFRPAGLDESWPVGQPVA